MWDALIRLPRGVKLAIVATVDAIALPVALWLSVALHASALQQPEIPIWLYFVVPLVAIPVFYKLGVYRAVVRYIGLDAITVIVRASTAMVLLLVAAVFGIGRDLPASIFIIFWGGSILAVSGSRLAARALISRSGTKAKTTDRVAIYGAGDAGRQLMSAIERSGRFQPVLFVDDDPQMQGRDIGGYSVESPPELKRLSVEYKIGHVVIAIPSLSRGRRLEIIGNLEELAVKVLVLPGLSEIMTSESFLASLREVDVEDLLNRESVQPDEVLLGQTISEKSVLITGAGGSIGSELARQIVRRKPSRLVLFDMSEYALFMIEREIRSVCLAGKLDVHIVPVLGNALNSERIAQVIVDYAVQTVYYAAAYKHVSLVETNPIEGVRNNVFGTLNALRASVEAGVERFVLVSTDKAVRPTNVMGASKRLAELVVQAYANSDTTTRLSIVRFGNVLGSSGSVVPLFREQIRNGGPVTVTHPEVTRYFMTIPEASQLSLQAGSMGESGEVFVLDMGQPVKILDLAKRMIHLSGYSLRRADRPDGDIEIQFTGLRPGEKLREELLIGDSDEPTVHPRIRVAREDSIPLDELVEFLANLESAVASQNVARVRVLLETAVAGYRPSASFARLGSGEADLDSKPMSDAHPTVTALNRRVAAPHPSHAAPADQ